ncbi:MAG: hydrogenase [Desulfotignum sp.]|nr:hydrogenase [Desulfotignum sp.]
MILQTVDTLSSLVLLSILFAFGSSRIPVLINVIAFQGLVVSVVPFFIGHQMTTGSMIFTIVTLVIRGILIPLSIHIAIKKVAIQRDVSPIIGYHASLFCGLGLIVAATIISRQLNISSISESHLVFPTAISLLVTGMFLLMARRNAIAMIAGYIMLENGIYLMGTTFSVRVRHVVEFGILLDVLAGVMIMAIILQNIKQTFDDVDTTHLRTLKE